MKFNMLFNDDFKLDASLRIENTNYQYDGEYFDNAYYNEFPLVNYGSDNDMLGSKVRTLLSGSQDAGYKNVLWNATNDQGDPVSAGMYICLLYTSDAADE